ncbi:MAG: peptidase [Bacteroidota bacterium]
MKRYLILVITAFGLMHISNAQKLNYTIDLEHRFDDTFKVTLDVKGLKEENAVYQFASTAPGTYQVMDMGRYVTYFSAFDKKGRELEVDSISVNKRRILEPKKVRKITYNIAETWDTPVEKNQIYRMCGSSIEKDHVLINGQTVFGFPSGMQDEPLSIKLNYIEDWEVGTALEPVGEKTYKADDYDHIVDSPILLGRLTKASTDLNGTDIDIYTYSKTDKIKSENLLDAMSEMLKAAQAFLVELPVDRYTFLFHFEDQTWGAWEHSYSSEYVYAEQEWSEDFGKRITSTAAHEFFHIVTPLNIHSEIIEQFNFETPTASEHLWLYEGTTEWASDLMQLRYGLIDLEEFFGELQRKISIDNQYDPSYSLSKLSLTSYTDEGQAQYGNIYMRGALVSGLLDIKLLELSGGKRGLREVVNELAKEYGSDRAFDEDRFFEVFTAKTYPEIAGFLDSYVKNAEPLPYKEYYEKIGIKYSEEIRTGKEVSALGMGFGVPDGKIRITALDEKLSGSGLEVNDELKGFDGVEINLQNARQMIGQLRSKSIGDEYVISVIREGEELEYPISVLAEDEVLRHVFELDENATAQQVALREAWMENL